MDSPKYRIVFRERFEKIFAKLSKINQQNILNDIKKLELHYSNHPQVKKIIGTKNGYRLRVGRWRILFAVENKTIDVIDLFTKKSKQDYRIRVKFFQ
jgi:mRNA-degrading endonuclease RelE of RelBE toxin-antitoxin system